MHFHISLRFSLVLAAVVVFIALGASGVYQANVPIETSAPTSVAPTTLGPTRLPTATPTRLPTTLNPTLTPT